MNKEELRARIEGLSEDELRALRAIINGKLSKRTISAEQQAKMQQARRKIT